MTDGTTYEIRKKYIEHGELRGAKAELENCIDALVHATGSSDPEAALMTCIAQLRERSEALHAAIHGTNRKADASGTATDSASVTHAEAREILKSMRQPASKEAHGAAVASAVERLMRGGIREI